jgi:hypothetical protein
MEKDNNTDGGRSDVASTPAKGGSRRRGRPQKDSENPAIEANNPTLFLNLWKLTMN